MRVLLAGLEMKDAIRGSWAPADASFVAVTAMELPESALACAPDLVLAAAELPELDQALSRLAGIWAAPVVLLAPVTGAPALPAGAEQVYGYLTRPVAGDALRLMCILAQAQFTRLVQARGEIAQLQEALTVRKAFERAKGWLMSERGMSEAEAYQYLRDESRRRRTPMMEIARELLDSLRPRPLAVREK